MMPLLTRKTVQKNLVCAALLTFLSRILGFWQDKLLIKFFCGATAESDAFHVAFRIPNLLRRIVGDGLLGATLIPTIVQFFQTGEQKRGLRLLTLFFVVTLLVFGTIWFWTWYTPVMVIKIFAPGLGIQQLNYAKSFLPRMFGLIFFLAGCEILSVGLRSVNHIFTSALGPSLYIITMIISLFLANKFSWSSNSLAWMVTIGGLIKFLVRYGAFKYFKLSLPPPNATTLADSGKVFIKMVPLLCGFGISETQNIVQVIVGSFLHTGEISILHYTWRLLNIPLVMLTQTTSLVFLPYFSGLNVLSRLRLRFLFLESTKLLFWLGMPLMIQLFFGAEDISRYFYGNTQAALPAVLKSVTVLQILSLGIIFSLVNQVLCTLFYALKDTLTPSSINGIATILNMTGSIIGLKYLGLPGIPLSTVLSSIIATPAFLLALSSKHHIQLPLRRTTSFVAKTCLQLTTFFALKTFVSYCFPGWAPILIYSLYPFVVLTRKIFGIKLFLLEPFR